MCVFVDTCVLINFLLIDGMKLLGEHPSQFITTGEVRGEIFQYRGEYQRERYETAVHDEHLRQEEIEGQLSRNTKRMFINPLYPFIQGGLACPPDIMQSIEQDELGKGERSIFAAAYYRGDRVATDDRGALNYARAVFNNHNHILTTHTIMQDLVQAGTLTDSEAGKIYAYWRQLGRFLHTGPYREKS